MPDCSDRILYFSRAHSLRRAQIRSVNLKLFRPQTMRSTCASDHLRMLADFTVQRRWSCCPPSPSATGRYHRCTGGQVIGSPPLRRNVGRLHDRGLHEPVDPRISMSFASACQTAPEFGWLRFDLNVRWRFWSSTQRHPRDLPWHRLGVPITRQSRFGHAGRQALCRGVRDLHLLRNIGSKLLHLIVRSPKSVRQRPRKLTAD